MAMNLGDYLPRGLMEWAPFIGASAAATGAAAARHLPAWFASKPEVTGILASAAVGAAMAASPGTRSAAAPIIIGGLAAMLPALVSKLAMGHGLSGLGYYAAETANPLLGMVQADQIAGLGYATASQEPHAYGVVPGVAGIGALAGPMQDYGQGAPINLLGSTNSLAAAFGSTHFS